ncbi:hypothetical protein HU200_044028 [Digitaria exilis]|uniref:Uncharacterized protein n=1 Tax=Digitaria exilis TaxID=1010633 RepID=A0A835EGY5_9POAL|nr:hypothetical protein HU200_044028 [Digitaria exilis]
MLLLFWQPTQAQVVLLSGTSMADCCGRRHTGMQGSRMFSLQKRWRQEMECVWLDPVAFKGSCWS